MLGKEVRHQLKIMANLCVLVYKALHIFYFILLATPRDLFPFCRWSPESLRNLDSNFNSGLTNYKVHSSGFLGNLSAFSGDQLLELGYVCVMDSIKPLRRVGCSGNVLVWKDVYVILNELQCHFNFKNNSNPLNSVFQTMGCSTLRRS